MKMCLAWAVAVTDGRDKGDLARDAVILFLLVLWLAAVWNIECYRLWSSQCVCLVAIGCNTATMIPRFFISLGFQTQIWLRLALILPLQHGVAALCILALVVAFRNERWPVSEVTIWAHDIRSTEALERSGALRSREEGGGEGANEGGRRDERQSVDQGRAVTEGSRGSGMAMHDGVGGGGGEASDGYDSRNVDTGADNEPGLGFPWVERGSVRMTFFLCRPPSFCCDACIWAARDCVCSSPRIVVPFSSHLAVHALCPVPHVLWCCCLPISFIVAYWRDRRGSLSWRGASSAQGAFCSKRRIARENLSERRDCETRSKNFLRS